MNILFIAAHPDDPEFFAGATLARWAAEGNAVSYVVVTGGPKGTDRTDITPHELAALREVEQRNAAAVLGVSNICFLHYVDGELSNTLELQRDLAREIRRAKPAIIATTDHETVHNSSRGINHNDHRVMGMAVCDAVFPASNNRMYFPELLAEGFELHYPKEIYFAGPVAPNTWVDVGDYLGQKARAVCEHRSQVKEPDPEKFESRFRQGMFRMKADGSVWFAEAFRRVML
jgi:LmbE family N-acetylglucosaminyl deacetylase